jgi:hypothetical protein
MNSDPNSSLLNTNILGAEDEPLKIIQQMFTEMKVQAIAGDVISYITKKLASPIDGVLPKAVEVKIQKGLGRVLISGKTLQAINHSIGMKAVENSIESLTKYTKATPKFMTQFARKTADVFTKRAASDTAEVAAKKAASRTGIEITEQVGKTVAQKAAAKALEDLTIGGVICGSGGATTGGVACVVGFAVTVMLLALDVVSLVLGFMDPENITALMGRDIIKAVKEATSKALYDQYPDQPRYYDEEVFLDLVPFLYTIDKNRNLRVDPEIGPLYNTFQDEYMTSIGITGDWRSRTPFVEMAVSDDSIYLIDPTTELIKTTRELNDVKLPYIPVWSVIAAAIIVITIIFLMLL